MQSLKAELELVLNFIVKKPLKVPHTSKYELLLTVIIFNWDDYNHDYYI